MPEIREKKPPERGLMEKRPKADIQELEREEKAKGHFAAGFGFYKLFWIFFIGCFLGVVIETIWCLITRGHYESRTGLIYGPLNLVYGFGALALTVSLYWLRKRSEIWVLIGSAVVGSVIEYLCSYVQERLFGSVSWDYSAMPFNLHGRINLLYSLFWGILGMVWIRELYPLLCRWILKIPNKVGKPLTWVLLVFMIFNSFMSGCAVLRWVERQKDRPPAVPLGAYFDRYYPDGRMEKIYANMKFISDREA